jgi:DNA-binding response OmpR family regulator
MADAAKTILCIEDDRETAKLIAEELGERGFDVLIAHEGHEGFISILKGIPDLVLCDIGMPQMSGFEILERLNEVSSRIEKVPFVFLTALSDRDSELRGRQLGADDYITKPIDFGILETIINARLAVVARTKIRPQPAQLNDREAEVLTGLRVVRHRHKSLISLACPSERSIFTSTALARNSVHKHAPRQS